MMSASERLFERDNSMIETKMLGTSSARYGWRSTCNWKGVQKGGGTFGFAGRGRERIRRIFSIGRYYEEGCAMRPFLARSKFKRGFYDVSFHFATVPFFPP